MLPDSDFDISAYQEISKNCRKDSMFALHLYACGEVSPPIAYDISSKSEPKGMPGK